MTRPLPLVACSLGPDDQQARLAQWRSLLATAAARTEVDGGARYVFDPADGLVGRVSELAAAESECCRFLRFDVEELASGVAMTVTTDAAGQAALRFVFR